MDGQSSTFEYKGVATTLTFTVKTADTVNIHNINVTNKPEPADPPNAVGNGKTDVWDFGAEQLDSAKYNNLLTVDLLNSFYAAGTEAGASGKNILSFNTGDLLFSAGGRTNNRLRTSNTALTRYDSKTKTIDGVDLTGMLYSNTSSSAGVFLGVKLYANDVLTLYTTSNGGASTIYCESPSGKIQEGQSSGDGAKLTFYASEYGMYKIYSINEKLTVWRALREHTNPVKVSGNVDTSAASAIASKDYRLCFTNTSTGEAKETAVTNGSYSIYLNDRYTYNVSLVDANGFIIKDNKALTLEKGAAATTRDLSIISVDLVTVTGKITGLSEDALAKLRLSFVNDKQAYVPEFTVSGDSITMLLEKGVTYNVIAEGVNDYEVTAKTISKTADGAQDIAFSAKPTYSVNVKYDGLPESARSSAVLTFTNINEDGYVYTFKAGETPKLRDGSYTVKVTGTGSEAYAQKLTSNVNIKGKAIDKTIPFEAVETWDFSKYNAGNPGIETIGESKYYLGLNLSGNVIENKTYLLANDGGEIGIPVKKGQLVTLEYCYQAAFEVDGKQILSASGSTSAYETVQVTAAADGFVTVKGITGTAENGKTAKQTYFTKITAAAPVAYKATLTVGKDKEFKTINEALATAAKMDRPNNERVEIVIDPGNYEEMLKVNIPNVTLKNAAGDKSSLSIINKGVDIGENVVRITSYYGTGYDYYSMTTGTMWDAETLAANKENGYLSHENAGDGKNNMSYWNATVVVNAAGFEADGIVFENSFNQYISKKESEDILELKLNAPKGGVRPTTYGDTSVQSRNFVERAAALALTGSADKAVFDNCKFIGRQDTLYGEQNIKAAFNKCDILGAVDYIFGGMSAVFYQCKLRMNTDDKASSDQAYLTAAQQASPYVQLHRNLYHPRS